MKGKILCSQRDDYIEIAKQLFYSKETIEKLKKATSVRECERILSNARREAR